MSELWRDEDYLIYLASLAGKIGVTKEEYIQMMVRLTSVFAEGQDTEAINYYRDYGYKGHEPLPFRPGVGDKMLFRMLAEQFVDDIPSKYRWPPFAERHSHFMFLGEYVPLFDATNRILSRE